MFLVSFTHGVRKFQWLQIEILVNHVKSMRHICVSFKTEKYYGYFLDSARRYLRNGRTRRHQFFLYTRSWLQQDLEYGFTGLYPCTVETVINDSMKYSSSPSHYPFWMVQWWYRWKSSCTIYKIQLKFSGPANHQGMETLVPPEGGIYYLQTCKNLN